MFEAVSDVNEIVYIENIFLYVFFLPFFTSITFYVIIVYFQRVFFCVTLYYLETASRWIYNRGEKQGLLLDYSVLQAVSIDLWVSCIVLLFRYSLRLLVYSCLE